MSNVGIKFNPYRVVAAADGSTSTFELDNPRLLLDLSGWSQLVVGLVLTSSADDATAKITLVYYDEVYQRFFEMLPSEEITIPGDGQYQAVFDSRAMPVAIKVTEITGTDAELEITYRMTRTRTFR